jgi:hypothetical protein
MNAVHQGLTWSTRRVVALFAAVMLAALVAGGAGGYLIRGASTLVVKPASVSPAQQQSVVRPYSEPHDIIPRASTGSSQGPFSETHDITATTRSGQGPFTEPHDSLK